MTRRRLLRTLAAVLAVLAAVAGWSVLLYLSSVHAAAANSDGATVVLEGRSLVAGNLGLDHWGLSLDSFWTVDALFYALAVAVAGVVPQLLHAVPAVIATLTIALAAFIARQGRRRWAAVAAAGAVVVLLGLPTAAFAEFFLMGPLHVATTLWCLLAILALRRRRFGWGVAASAALLAAGMLGDLLALAIGVLPVALAGGVAMLRSRRVGAGLPAVAAAAGGVAAWQVARRVAVALGSFSVGPANPRAPVHQMLANLGHVVTYGAALAGVGVGPFAAPSIPPVLEAAHAAGAALGVAAVLVGLAGLVRSSLTGAERAAPPGSAEGEWTFLGDAVLIGFLGSCAVFVYLSFNSTPPFGRYLTPALVYAAILAGHLLGRLVERLRGRVVPAVASAACLVVVAGYGATFARTLVAAPPAEGAARLAAYLERHHLDRGVGAYWSSSIVTVESSGRVALRPVVALSGGRLARYPRNSEASWYGGGFQFLVFQPSAPWGGVDAASAARSFGAPRRVVRIGSYEVLTYRHDLRIEPDGAYVTQAWRAGGPGG